MQADTAIFVNDIQDGKKNCSSKFYDYYFLKVQLHNFSKKVIKKFFLYIFAC
jgi:hypothetical protein